MHSELVKRRLFFFNPSYNSARTLTAATAADQTARFYTYEEALIKGPAPDWFFLASFLLSSRILSWCNKSNYQRPLPRPRDGKESMCYQTHTHTQAPTPPTHTHALSNADQYVVCVFSSPATE